MNELLRVNVSDKSATRTPVPEAYLPLGGRALIARILLDEVKATCEPLGPHNKLIFAAGLLAGTGASSSGRLSVGGKSPLTGGVKESNAGGITAGRMAKHGLRAVIVEGANLQVIDTVEDGTWHAVHVVGYAFHRLLEPSENQ